MPKFLKTCLFSIAFVLFSLSSSAQVKVSAALGSQLNLHGLLAYTFPHFTITPEVALRVQTQSVHTGAFASLLFLDYRDLGDGDPDSNVPGLVSARYRYEGGHFGFILGKKFKHENLDIALNAKCGILIGVVALSDYDANEHYYEWAGIRHTFGLELFMQKNVGNGFSWFLCAEPNVLYEPIGALFPNFNLTAGISYSLAFNKQK